MSLEGLAEVLGGTLHTRPAGAQDMLEWPVEHLLIDSRGGLPGGNSLFVALRGERHDGHRYIPELLERGVRAFLVDHLPEELPSAVDHRCAFLVVADTLDAFQRTVARHRASFRIPVVGITGSNGKTVVKEWLFQLLRGSEHIVRSPGSWNSQVGVPLSVWEMRPEHTMGLFEAGISRPGEMDRLRPVVKPTIGVFTNIGPAHGENFTNDLEKSLEKMKLFTQADALVYCADHVVVEEALHKSGLHQSLQRRGWSRERNGWLHVVNERSTAHGTHVTVINDEVSFAFDVPFTDPASVENALHCVTLLLHLGHAPAWIAEHTPHLAPVAMRLEIVDGHNGITLINDAYSNDVASLAIALEHLDRMAAGRPKAVVLSDILESGDAPEMLYQRVAALIEKAGVATLFAIGPQLAAQRHRFACVVHAFADTGALLEATDPAQLAGHAVLVKGARSFALERVVQRWQRQVHGTVLEIDLGAIGHNLNHYRAMLKPGVRTMAMVKAFGYGTGALELARLFAHERVDHLGVAYADEGIELRQEGIDLPILVMNPEPVPQELLHRFRLEAEVYDERSLREAADHQRDHPDAPPVHLKLDTGMHRLGWTPAELPALLDLLRAMPHLRVATVLSHFAASEAPEHDAFTREQLATFLGMADAVDDVLGCHPLRHIANSAAVARMPETHLDMVRLGIGLHGVGCNAEVGMQLLPAASLRSPIAQLRPVAAGDGVGYGRGGASTGDRMIATLPIGYADGLSRRLGHGKGKLWLHGRAAPIVGSVCMDMVMIDVTGIACQVGDHAFLFNADHPITELASDLGTIPYEVLTSIPPRVKRMYVRA
jgi:alanine racemase